MKREPDDLARVVLRLGDQPFVIGVQHELPRVANRAADYPLAVQQFVEIPRTEIAEMILGDVRDQCGIRLFDTETPTQ